jgi:3-oxoacyl-[acyl-carrier-protein] synthase II
MKLQRVFITGIGAISPNGIGRETFWGNSKQGRSGVRRISRFDVGEQPVQVAGEVSGFDVSAYLSPREMEHTSLATPFSIAASAEALADAGIEWRGLDHEALRRYQVVIGTGGGAQEFTERQYSLFYSGQQKKCSVYVIPSSTLGTLSSEISMHFGFRGLSHVLSNGCTSSTDALGYAFRAIRYGEADTVLAGGVDAPIGPLTLRGFQLLRIMSTGRNQEPERASRPFSADRDGFVIAEGAWFFVLESEASVMARGARPYAELLGYGATCEAFHRVRLEEVGIEPARAMQMALEQAGVPAEAVDYLHYHGTATQLNDRVETTAVKLAFGAHAKRLAGSSIKSIIGHPQGACGAASLAATALAMRDSYAAPTINLEQPDPQCDLDYIPNTGRALRIEHAVVNTIAFGSKNAALVLRRVDSGRSPV